MIFFYDIAVATTTLKQLILGVTNLGTDLLNLHSNAVYSLRID